MKSPTSFKAGWNVTKKVAGKGLKGAFALEIANNIRQKDYASAAENAALMAPGKLAKAAGRIATASRAATGVGAMLYSAPLGNASEDWAMGEKLKKRLESSKGRKVANKVRG